MYICMSFVSSNRESPLSAEGGNKGAKFVLGRLLVLPRGQRSASFGLLES